MITSALSPLPTPTLPRWRPLRAGIVGIHHYDEQVFVFHRGKLLLRGANGTGKSIAIEVLLPYLLDANIAPERISTFGGRDRSMHWKIIGHDETGRANGRAYVWCEFGRRHPDGSVEYFTLGAGLEATRGDRDVKHWYFTTSQRIGLDLLLLRGREPLSSKALGEALAGHGVVASNSPAYRRTVNSTLFGLSDAQYAALCSMLIELRRPKLSEKLDPTGLSGLLTDALPPVDEPIIAELAGGFERLDRHTSELAELSETTRAARSLAQSYTVYARRIAHRRVADVRGAETAVDNLTKSRREAQERHSAACEESAELKTTLSDLERSQIALRGRLEGLQQRPEFVQGEQLHFLDSRAQTLADDVKRIERDLTVRQDAMARSRATHVAAERTLAAASDEAEAAGAAAHVEARPVGGERLVVDVQAALTAASESDAPDPKVPVAHQLLRSAENDWTAVRKAVARAEKAHVDAIEAVRRAQQEVENHNAIVVAAEEKVAAADNALGSAHAAYAEAVGGWVATADELTGARPVPGDLDFSDPDAVAVWCAEARTDAEAEYAASIRSHREEISRLNAEADLLQVQRADLERATGPRRPVPAWRRPDRPAGQGAALFELVDFAPEASQLPALEAACEGLGLLDAFVTAAGVELPEDTFDLFARAAGSGGDEHQGLADWLVVDEVACVRAGVRPQTVAEVLARVAVGAHATAATAGAAVAVGLDGSWQAGVLAGQSGKERVELIGEAARQRTRAEQIAALTERIAAGEVEVTSRTAQIAGLTERTQRVRAQAGALPSREALNKAADALRRAEGQRTQALGQLQIRKQAEAKTLTERERARGELSLLAEGHGLTAWLGRLDELEAAQRSFADSIRLWLTDAGELFRARARLERTFSDFSETELQVDTEASRLKAAQKEALKVSEEANGLRDAIGASYEQIVVEIADIKAEQTGGETELESGRTRQLDLAGIVGKALAAFEQAEADRAAALAERERADLGLVALSRPGVLAAAGFPDVLLAGVADGQSQEDEADAELPSQETLGGFSHTRVLTAARTLWGALAREEGDERAAEQAANIVTRRRHELSEALASLHVRDHSEGGVLLLVAVKDGQPLDITSLIAALEADVVRAREILSADEQELFAEFLTGRVREEIAARVRDAGELVERMNAQLSAVRTVSGLRVKLRWLPNAEDDAAGPSRVLDLLLRDPEHLYDSEREALLGFFRGQLERVRTEPVGRSWQDRLVSILDYRKWFTFSVAFRTGEADWKELTRKAHATMSGGEKAVTLHLPLFAAATAHYRGATIDCPRLIVLDEVFAGVDDDLRGQLFDLVREFDLDVVATSEREPGTHAELDGIGIYQLVAYPGAAFVVVLRSVWDGDALYVAEDVPEPAPAAPDGLFDG